MKIISYFKIVEHWKLNTFVANKRTNQMYTILKMVNNNNIKQTNKRKKEKEKNQTNT